MLTPREYDILVIGSGAAGLGLALSLANRYKIAVVCKDDGLSSSSQYAQGGIAAVMDENDSVASHITDTLIAGDGLCDKKATRFILENGKPAIDWLMQHGVKFTLSSKTHQLHLTQEGGHSHRRVVHAQDKTGAVVVKTLAEQIHEHKNIDSYVERTAIDLLITANQCYGAEFLNNETQAIETFHAKHVVLATGGANHMYLHTSSAKHTSGDGIAMAYRAGCRIANMEFNQFHPTSFYHPHAHPFLITEAMRGEGATLLLPNGQRFMPQYDKRAELAPRDIVARAIDSEMKKNQINHVYLDISHKAKTFIQQFFPTIYQHCLTAGIDISQQPIPVVPAAHYTCGGIVTNLYGETDVKQLYAIGETACTGLHGANRMASNSLLECLVMAMSAAKKIEATQITSLASSHATTTQSVTSSPHHTLADTSAKIRHLMWQHVGIVRNNDGLKLALEKITALHHHIENNWAQLPLNRKNIETRNVALNALLTTTMAAARQESRGLHFNTDYPNKNPVASNSVLQRDSVPVSYRTELQDPG